MNKAIILLAAIALTATSCKENKTETPKETISIESTPVKNTEVQSTNAIPMHGTGVNSSSSTNGSFKMDENMKKNIQQQKEQE